ncbi:MAG: ADP-ribosylglycohydrolase family protein, partial [bacterium]|nr:ADP-ribosylglycohydrolase family protein [Candidatus Limimorpha equi]
MDKNKKDKIRGSLIGGAVGDALGYPVEFISSYSGIKKRYGDNGITRLDTTQW